jgi:dCMP deaminase
MLALCTKVSETSHDPHRQVGCVITNPSGNILVTASNQLPRGISLTDEKVTRPQKYLWMEHAERNAIYEAARKGISLQGCTIYLNWWPCVECTRAIIQSGITKIVAPEMPNLKHHRWGEQFKLTFEMLSESNTEWSITSE